jgi:hypothetical protein
MARFVEGMDRGQVTLLPECLEDWVDENNPVRAVDVFVGALDLVELGFDGAQPMATGRPGYKPSVLLKLYIYGYLNRVQSSRRLEREAALHTDNLDAVADRGYFKGEEILACEKAGIAVTLPPPQTSGAKSEGRFGKPDFVYLPTEDVYRCPAGEKLTYRYTSEEDGQNLRRYCTSACATRSHIIAASASG